MENQNEKNVDPRSGLANRGIFTLEQWCVENGHEGVTKECLLVASQMEDPKLREMAQEHLKSGIIKKVKEEEK